MGLDTNQRLFPILVPLRSAVSQYKTKIMPCYTMNTMHYLSYNATHSFIKFCIDIDVSELEKHIYQPLKKAYSEVKSELSKLVNKLGERAGEIVKEEKETMTDMDNVTENCAKMLEEVKKKTKEQVSLKQHPAHPQLYTETQYITCLLPVQYCIKLINFDKTSTQQDRKH